MSTKWPVAMIAVGIVVGGIGGAVYYGVGGMGPGSEETITDTPVSTGTVYESTDGTGTVTRTEQRPPPPFSLAITRIVECGTTCRDVTVELSNDQDRRATDVVVYTRVFSGRNTDTSNMIWEGREPVGTMAAGETVNSTRRIELTFGEARAVQNKDGWITIVTTVESDDVTITFRREEQVT